MTQAPPLRVALTGCGWYATNHLHAWRDLAPDGVQLVGVCDIVEENARRAAAIFGVPAFSDTGEMLAATQPDLLDIVTTAPSHAELVELAAARGTAIVVQKPLAVDWASCLRIAETVRRSGIFFAVHENFRFQAPLRRVHHMLRNGVIGAPTFARVAFRTSFDTIAAQPYLREVERFILLDIGVHVLDLARLFMGDVERLTCETQQRRDGIKGEDTASMLLRHESGAVSVVECSFSAQRIVDCFPETLVEIEGPDGCIMLGPSGIIDVQSKGVRWREDASAPLLPWTERPLHVTQESVLSFNRHIVEALRAGTPPETRLDDALKTFALVEAAYASARDGTSIVPQRVSA